MTYESSETAAFFLKHNDQFIKVCDLISINGPEAPAISATSPFDDDFTLPEEELSRADVLSIIPNGISNDSKDKMIEAYLIGRINTYNIRFMRDAIWEFEGKIRYLSGELIELHVIGVPRLV